MFAGLESPVHLLLLLLIILLLFGAKRLPEMGRSLGRGIQEFKEGLNTKNEPKNSHPEILEKEEEKANAKEAAQQGKKKAEPTQG